MFYILIKNRQTFSSFRMGETELSLLMCFHSKIHIYDTRKTVNKTESPRVRKSKTIAYA